MIHSLRLSFSNVHLIAGPTALLVDTGSPGESQKILKWIEALGLGHPKAILLTHAHADHAGSAADLRRTTKAPIYLASADWALAKTGGSTTLRPTRPSAWPLKFFVPSGYEAFVPDGVLDQATAAEHLGREVALLHTPGHTPGSISLVFPDGNAVVGDLLMGGFLGGALRPNRPRHHYFTDNAAKVSSSLDLVLGHGARTLHVGHGGPLSAADIKRWRQK